MVGFVENFVLSSPRLRHQPRAHLLAAASHLLVLSSLFVIFPTKIVRGLPTTIVGPPEVMGGPLCCVFDSPFLALRRLDNTTLAYTANSKSFLWSLGPSVDSQLETPIYVNLGPDPNNISYSHCGKWLNAAFMDNAGTIHGYFHQEWHCDYAHALYTNKSVGYAVSYDGGESFQEVSNSQIIAGSNFSQTHETGEGDHGVVQFGDWLYLYFIEWDAPSSIHGGTSLGVARSSIEDAGRPGTWKKYYNGEWAEPGVGGRASTIANMPGTAVYWVPDAAMLLSIGVIFSAPLLASWSSDGIAWVPSPAGPLFSAGWSSWDRNASSSELFGYPSLTGPHGAATGLPSKAYVYVTYLRPGTGFDQRWMVRRPLQLVASDTNSTPPALAAMSLWHSTATPLRVWPTTGPVVPPEGFTLALPSLALLVTWAPPSPAPRLAELIECQLAAAPLAVALTRAGECGAGKFAAGTALRTAGWVATSASDGRALGWGRVRDLGTRRVQGRAVGALWRCVSVAQSGNYSVALDDGGSCASAGAGFAADVLLGYAIAPTSAS